MKKLILLACIAGSMLCSCNKSSQPKAETVEDTVSIPCCCGEIHRIIDDSIPNGDFTPDESIDYYGIVIRPDKSISKKELKQLVKDMRKHKKEFCVDDNCFNINILPSKDLSKGFSPNGRIRADYLLKADTLYNACSFIEEDFLAHKGFEMAHDNVVYITHKDICVPYKGKPEWGVLGLSFLGKRVSIVSTYRLKNKRDLWKLVAHELNHSQGIPHCTSGDIHCIMQDANGHPKFNIETHLCKDCRKKYKGKYNM